MCKEIHPAPREVHFSDWERQKHRQATSIAGKILQAFKCLCQQQKVVHLLASCVSAVLLKDKTNKSPVYSADFYSSLSVKLRQIIYGRAISLPSFKNPYLILFSSPEL